MSVYSNPKRKGVQVRLPKIEHVQVHLMSEKMMLECVRCLVSIFLKPQIGCSISNDEHVPFRLMIDKDVVGQFSNFNLFQVILSKPVHLQRHLLIPTRFRGSPPTTPK